jgi:hypothetical protein
VLLQAKMSRLQVRTIVSVVLESVWFPGSLKERTKVLTAHVLVYSLVPSSTVCQPSVIFVIESDSKDNSFGCGVVME